MRLGYSDTEKRATISLDKSINPDDSLGGIMKFGDDNLYPQTIESLIAGSPTAKACSNIYAKFLTGAGFNNTAINKVIIGRDQRGKDITLGELLRQASNSISKYKGLYIHTNKTRENKVSKANLIPFKNCRFNKQDDLGFCSQVMAYGNWEKRRDIKFDKNKIKAYDIFTTNNEQFILQVKNSSNGDITKYTGQVYIHFMDPEYLYPLSQIDSVYLDCDTEAKISVFRNSEINNGFQARTVILMSEPPSEEEETKSVEKVKAMTGADGSRTTLFFVQRNEEGKLIKDENFYTETIQSTIDDKLFDSWVTGLANNIRKAFNGLPALLIDYEQGAMSGTSGEAITQATTYYNEITKDDRASLSMVFKEIFSKSVWPELENNLDWSIKPLSLYNGTTDISATASN